MNLLDPHSWNPIFPKEWTKKQKFFVGTITSFCLFFFSTTTMLGLKYLDIFDINQDLKSENGDLRSEGETFKMISNNKTERLQILGESDELPNPMRSFEDFKRDWDVSDFYTKNDNLLCPKEKGQNKYQRIKYKNSIPLIASNLGLKFEMQPIDDSTNTQRIIIGLFQDEKILSEYHLPTRAKDGQVVNYYEISEDEKLQPESPGKTFSPPVEEGSTISLSFGTKKIHGNTVSQILNWDYFSSVKEYGKQSKSLSNEIYIEDPNIDTSRVGFFIGSYVGHCIQIQEWKAN